jgi:hypothetical protein
VATERTRSKGHAVKQDDNIGASYSFSHTAHAASHEIYETPSTSPNPSGITIPLDAFMHASAMQAIARYLIDTHGLGFTHAAHLLGRSPKSIWSSYHQIAALPEIKESLPIPIHIFYGKAPLEALIPHLKSLGMKNAEIARQLDLSPKTIWTAAKRAEAKK